MLSCLPLQAFPYSVSFVKLLNPEGQLYPSAYYDELSQMIDSLNRPSVYNRQRRDMAEPVKSKSTIINHQNSAINICIYTVIYLIRCRIRMPIQVLPYLRRVNCSSLYSLVTIFHSLFLSSLPCEIKQNSLYYLYSFTHIVSTKRFKGQTER